MRFKSKHEIREPEIQKEKLPNVAPVNSSVEDLKAFLIEKEYDLHCVQSGRNKV